VSWPTPSTETSACGRSRADCSHGPPCGGTAAGSGSSRTRGLDRYRAVVTSWVRPEGASLRAGGAGSYERGALWAKADILRWAKGYRGGAKHRVTQPYAGRGCRARNLGSRPRSFFEFARPAPPRQPRWGSQTVHRARHLFGEHCLATPAPMSYLSRSQEGSITHQGTDSGFGPANGARG
jgi:hypothetical protein